MGLVVVAGLVVTVMSVYWATFAHARGWSIEGLQQAIGVTAELNADVKGAAASADYALERAVRRIVTIRSETGRGSRARTGR